MFDLTYTTTQNQTLTNPLGATEPAIWSLGYNELVVGSRIVNLNKSVMTNNDLSTYLSQVF